MIRSGQAIVDNEPDIFLFVNVYFGSNYNAANGDVKCVWRDLDELNTGVADAFLTRLAVAPGTLPGVRELFMDMPDPHTNSSFHYWTIACRLPPKTGINSIDVNVEPN